MKLYYTPGTCSLASHIVIKELQLPIDLERVDLATRRTEREQDFHLVNPDGYVPALELGDGQVLTESPAILQYLSDIHGSNVMLPEVGTLERYRVLEMLSYVATELHQKLGPLVDPTSSEAAKSAAHSKIRARLGRLDLRLSDHAFVATEHFTIADAYAFAILGALRHFQVDLSTFLHVQAFIGRTAQRSSVDQAMRAEGLLA